MTYRERRKTGARSLSEVAEHRGRKFYSSGWPWKNWTNTGTPVWYDRTFTEYMLDATDKPPFPDHDLHHEKFRGHPGRLIGQTERISAVYGVPDYQVKFSNYHVGTRGSDYTDSGHLPVDMPGHPDSYVNKAIGMGHPGVPEVDLAEFLVELREIPAIIFPKHVLTVPISILFGVLPFLRDLFALADIADSIDKRMELINSMVGREKKRKLGLGKTESTKTKSSVTFGAHLEERWTTNLRAWCVKTETIESNKLKPPRKFNTSQVRNLLISDLPILTAWNLMPWSFMIDYFVNVDDMIRAHNNRVPGYKISSLCVCVETKTKYQIKHTGSFDSYWSGNVRVGGGRYERLTQRRGIYPNPTPRLPRLYPLLSPSQLGNLLAVAAALAGSHSQVSTLTSGR